MEVESFDLRILFLPLLDRCRFNCRLRTCQVLAEHEKIRRLDLRNFVYYFSDPSLLDSVRWLGSGAWCREVCHLSSFQLYHLQIVLYHTNRYKTSWGTFQVRYFRVTGENLKFPRLQFLIVIISIGCLLCAVLFIVSLSYLLEGFPMWHTCAYCTQFFRIIFVYCHYLISYLLLPRLADHTMTMLNMNSALWYKVQNMKRNFLKD